MNSKICSNLSYLVVLVLAITIRILYPLDDIIIDVILFSGGLFIYQRQKDSYSVGFALLSILLILMIDLISFLLGLSFRMLFFDDKIMSGIMYIIIDLIKVIGLVLIYCKLCENIKFRDIKKYIIISILLCFIITIVPLIRITFINEFLVVNSMAELEFWICVLKQSSLIIQDFIKWIIIILLGKEMKRMASSTCLNELV